MTGARDALGRKLGDLVVKVNDRTPGDISGTRPYEYNATTSIYNLKNSNTRRVRAALAGVLAGTGSCRIAGVGHSIIAGVGATPGVNDSLADLVTLLNGKGYPRSGSGLAAGYRGATAIDPRWSFGSGWGSFGAMTSMVSNNTNSNAAVFTSTHPGTRVDVRYWNNTGVFTVTIDGGSPVTVTGTNGGAMATYSVTGLSDAVHTVSISRQSATALIIGVEVRYDTTGVRIYNGGIGGMVAASLADSNGYATPKVASTWGADLVILEIIANDAFYGNNVATWKTNVNTAITNATAGGANLLLVADNPISTVNQASYRTALYELADQWDCPLLDMHDRLESYTVANASGLMSDGTHPNGAGLAVQAAAYLPVLGIA